jgi:uncharacterized phage protein (predicted DNA packaging)
MTTEITLAEAKLHCRIDGTDEDALIQAYIDAALEVCQKHIGKRFDKAGVHPGYQDWLPDVRLSVVRVPHDD